MECISCLRGFSFECGHEPEKEKPSVDVVEEINNLLNEDEDTLFTEAVEKEKRSPGRPPKPDNEIGESAGRKRAAELYNETLHTLEWCEWRLKANCGGGKKPILGCLAGKPKNIHHGPVKATYRNERTNIHLICPDCHNNWHTANDPIYSEDEYNNLPPFPRPMTQDEMFIVATGKRLINVGEVSSNS